MPLLNMGIFQLFPSKILLFYPGESFHTAPWAHLGFPLEKTCLKQWLFTKFPFFPLCLPDKLKFSPQIFCGKCWPALLARRPPKFSGSSAEPFHRKLRALKPSQFSSPPCHHKAKKLKIVLPWVHPQNMNLSALKRGTKEGILTGKHRKWSSSLWNAARPLLEFQPCLLPGRTDKFSLTSEDEKWGFKSSPGPGLEANRNGRWCLCVGLVWVYHRVVSLHN